MLKIFTSTFCRPDYVQLSANALNLTTQEKYRFIVVVHPKGLKREWGLVDEVVNGKNSGYYAWKGMISMIGGSGVIIHDDCIPILNWSSSIFKGTNVIRIWGFTPAVPF